MTRRSCLDRSDAIHSASRSADSATNRREAADFEVPSPVMTGISPSGSRTGRQRNFMAVVTAHPRAMHGNLATMETDLSVGPAPAVADAASTTIMRRAGELLRILAKHLLDGSDPDRQTEALEGAVHILPTRLKAGHERER